MVLPMIYLIHWSDTCKNWMDPREWLKLLLAHQSGCPDHTVMDFTVTGRYNKNLGVWCVIPDIVNVFNSLLIGKLD